MKETKVCLKSGLRAADRESGNPERETRVQPLLNPIFNVSWPLHQLKRTRVNVLIGAHLLVACRGAAAHLNPAVLERFNTPRKNDDRSIRLSSLSRTRGPCHRLARLYLAVTRSPGETCVRFDADVSVESEFE